MSKHLLTLITKADMHRCVERKRFASPSELSYDSIYLVHSDLEDVYKTPEIAIGMCNAALFFCQITAKMCPGDTALSVSVAGDNIWCTLTSAK